MRAGFWSIAVMALMAKEPAATPFEALRKAGWDAAYQTDYATAKIKFRKLQKLYPEHPVGDLSMASTIWQEYLFRMRRLQTNVYKKGSKFYEGASKGKEGKEGEAIDPAVDGAFQENLGRAMAKAQAMADSSPNSAEAVYQLGAVYGIRAAYAASAQRKFLAAFRDGLKSVSLHRRVLELDPQFVDAHLTTGLYHYAVGTMPFAFRVIASMAGITGSKKKGLEELELVMQRGKYNCDDARAILAAVYRYEGAPQKALAVLETYSARYPRNVLLRIEMASTLAQMKRGKEAAAKFEELLRETDRRVMDLVHYQYGEALAVDRAWGAAVEQFTAVETVPETTVEMRALAHLRAGNMYDMAQQRAAALRSYQACLAQGGSPTFRKGVERYLSHPYVARYGADSL